jgi:GST-like protein
MAGQAHHFSKFNPEASTYAKKRYIDETKRLYKVLNRQLEDKDYIVDEYSIADIAAWPWVSRFEWQQINLSDFPNVQRWYRHIAKRPAVLAGYHVPNFISDIPGC